MIEADAFPQSEVIGVDLSPTQPTMVPANCTFEIEDLEKDWTWAKPFDFIFSRVMAGSFEDYAAFISKANNALEPGGWFEMQDIVLPYKSDDGTFYPELELTKLGHYFGEASKILGRSIEAPRHYKSMMQKAGFVNIVERHFKWPLNAWAKDPYYKEIGAWSFANLDGGLEGLTLALFTRGMKWTREETIVFCAEVRKQLRDPKIHAYLPVIVVYGQKADVNPDTSIFSAKYKTRGHLDSPLMSASPPSGSSKRRVRTEAQMSQKRLADRVKHRENRQEHKQRMERMEADIAQIRKNLDTVSAQLRTLPQLSADLVALQQRSSQKPPGEAYEMDTSIETPDFPAGRRAAPAGAPCATDHHDIPPAEVPEVVSSLFPTPSHVDCRCGVQHHSQADCLEYRSFAILYETHAAFPKDPLHARSLPRNPELPNMTLHSYGDNAVTCFLTSFLKGFEMASVETLFGVYFFAYRLMRWRLHPDPMTLKDVPTWLLPTEVQNTYPHPVSIDYIPWPDLRDFLCTNPRIKSRHSVKIYLESLQLKWPPGCPLMAVENGQVCVSPEFEAIACDLNNWELGPPWLEAFPRLVSLVHP
ncbi:hypothetical protein FGADI_9540 [Fusarium gaditjirri]|uniref:Methyltransferase n=1 Tax=Fusarium gaditjirri TaxID=282569 RepID=A0A8H4SZR4_9HYPO|nr:hypothetical protein FGADI_9540 [Fusarium gaditjirri]